MVDLSNEEKKGLWKLNGLFLTIALVIIGGIVVACGKPYSQQNETERAETLDNIRKFVPHAATDINVYDEHTATYHFYCEGKNRLFYLSVYSIGNNGQTHTVSELSK